VPRRTPTHRHPPALLAGILDRSSGCGELGICWDFRFSSMNHDPEIDPWMFLVRNRVWRLLVEPKRGEPWYDPNPRLRLQHIVATALIRDWKSLFWILRKRSIDQEINRSRDQGVTQKDKARSTNHLVVWTRVWSESCPPPACRPDRTRKVHLSWFH